MSKSRLEAFSDGVIAILITVMLLEMKVPHGSDFGALASTGPVFASYVVSFVYIGIYWNNHHHMLHLTRAINGRIMWANLHLLFWLSLVPFVTGWVGENPSAHVPASLYGFVLLMAGTAYEILRRTILASEGADSRLNVITGEDRKGKLSIVLYLSAIALGFVSAHISYALIVAVAIIWLVPDRRAEVAVQE